MTTVRLGSHMDDRQKAALVRAVGRAIAMRRVAARLSQEKVAEKLGISREAVSRLETGVAMPSVVRLAELAEILNCGIEELLTEASNREQDQARNIVVLLGGLPTEKRELLMSVMKQLAHGMAH
ncbi:helix-turn-helix domain-containing protein [Paraburkholderia caballeronis]|nr:helix-turn-helix transcriptional regulator [Paraburkholderia caballeronis]